MSGILGEVRCRLKRGSSELVLEHTVLDTKLLITQEQMQESIVTGARTWVRDWDQAEFKVTEYLWKYENPAEIFSKIMSYMYGKVEFRLDYAKDMMKNYFYLTEVSMVNLSNMIEKDVAILTIVSAERVVVYPSGYGLHYGSGYGRRL